MIVNNMVDNTAFVLITSDLTDSRALLDELCVLDEVKEVCLTSGLYDYVVKLVAPVDRLRYVITWKIRKIEGIKSTLTLMKNQ